MCDNKSCSRKAGCGSQDAGKTGPQVSVTNVVVYKIGGTTIFYEDGVARTATRDEVLEYLRSAGVDI